MHQLALLNVDFFVFCLERLLLHAHHHIIKMVISGVNWPVGQVGQWAMAHLKGLAPHMNTLWVPF